MDDIDQLALTKLIPGQYNLLKISMINQGDFVPTLWVDDVYVFHSVCKHRVYQ
jgi:hypothetical protein